MFQKYKHSAQVMFLNIHKLYAKIRHISLNYAFETMNLDRVYADAHFENEGSNRILRKVGMNFIETFYIEDIKCNWYKIDKNEYENRKLSR